MTPAKQFAPASIKNTVSHHDVDKLDVRVGTIERVDEVQKSTKLLKLTVNFGDHRRRILVGMKGERSNPAEEIVGKQALFVINLTPKKMAGEISEGMLFDIGFSDGLTPVLAVPEKYIPNGSRAG
jgi:methionine--tRNA ligase beta chain